MTERIAHGIDFVPQLIAALLADKEESAVVVGREQREAESAVERQQALVLITRKQGGQQTLDEDDGNGQRTEKYGRLVLASFLQEEVEHRQQHGQPGKVEQSREEDRHRHFQHLAAFVWL